MGRLTNLKPAIGGLASRIARQADDHGHSKAAEPWRAWYSLKRWLDLRPVVFRRDRYTCQMAGCGKLVWRKGQAILDHKIPHRGDERLFWDQDNLQTLCKPCHDGAKQREERSSQIGR